MEHWIANMQEFWRAQRAEGMAALLAIGTATPANVFYQAEYPDYFFRVTNSEHLIELKNKFTRICENSRIHKRHLHLNEDILAANPSIAADWAPSLDARQDILAAAVPKLGKEAADKAIKEWGQPKSRITHLVFCSTTGVHMPGADLQLVKLLGLSCSVRRIMLYNIGYYAGGTVLRVAKDLAENNRGARVLVVCSEVTAVAFRAPSKTNPDDLVEHALFADGAAAIVVGADPDPTAECTLFQIVHTHQAFLPGSAEVVTAHLGEVGLMLHLSKELPGLISEKVEECLREAFRPLGMMSDGSVDWNSVFWAAHPGGARILDMIEAKVGLREERLRASRHVLSEYGNMISASVLFLLDEMRKWSAAKGKATTGEGLDWGGAPRLRAGPHSGDSRPTKYAHPLMLAFGRGNLEIK